MKALRWPLLWWGIFVALMVLVAVVSLGPPPASPDVPNADKWEHLTTYAGLALVAVQIFRPGRPLLVAGLALVLLGVLLEVGQGTLTTDRMMDWRDAVANTIGVGLGLLTSRTGIRDALVRAIPSTP